MADVVPLGFPPIQQHEIGDLGARLERRLDVALLIVGHRPEAIVVERVRPTSSSSLAPVVEIASTRITPPSPIALASLVRVVSLAPEVEQLQPEHTPASSVNDQFSSDTPHDDRTHVEREWTRR
jgi:hypothetical protein